MQNAVTSHYPLVLEHELNGTVSAYVVGVPGVFASADSERAAVSGIRAALKAHLTALNDLPARRSTVRSSLRVAKVTFAKGRSVPKVGLVGLGALMGRRRSAAKAEAARANGRKGGRPRKVTQP